uniref:Putative secreted protein n=1 Tax=Ixodes ricinus TaxID=34613 RepID=A0A6B0URS0_IXORI
MSASFRFFTVLIFTVSVNSYMFLIFFFSSVSPIISFSKMLNSQLYIKCQCKNLFTFCFSVLFQIVTCNTSRTKLTRGCFPSALHDGAIYLVSLYWLLKVRNFGGLERTELDGHLRIPNLFANTLKATHTEYM